MSDKIDSVWVVSPQDYPHSQAFAEVAASFSDALEDLGYKILRTANPPKTGKSLIFGAHLMDETNGIVPKEGDVIYQTEQVAANSLWMTKKYYDILRGHEIWDYSKSNIEHLAKYGIEAKHVPIGYMPSMRTLEVPLVEDIDVVFTGSLNERRSQMLEKIKQAGIGVIPINGYGRWRDKYLTRAKIVLNMHFYDTAIFEIFRCAHYFANEKCVVSEMGKDIEMEERFYGKANFCDYDDIIETCKYFLSNEARRAETAKVAADEFKSKTQTQILQEAGVA